MLVKPLIGVLTLDCFFSMVVAMKKYSHNFVESHDGLMGFGWDRSNDENTAICYLQMFSDDDLMKTLIGRLTDEELNNIYELINRLLKTHLKNAEYHRLFLKDEHS